MGENGCLKSTKENSPTLADESVMISRSPWKDLRNECRKELMFYMEILQPNSQEFVWYIQTLGIDAIISKIAIGSIQNALYNR